MSSRMLTIAICVAICLTAPRDLLAAGGTSMVASKGQPAYVSRGWPQGVDDLVNDPLRTDGWNSWFTEWPNDVNQYAYDVKSTADINRLIEKLAAIKVGVRQIRLCDLKKPEGFGWVSSFDVGNNIAVVCSVGDQARIDEWFKQVRKPFGVMEFSAAPVAVPPTLTIFVQNPAVNLKELKIPEGIEVTAGYIPTVFHKSNTGLEQQQEKTAAKQKTEKPDPAQQEAIQAALKKHRDSLDEPTRAAEDAIAAFLETREKAEKKP